VTVLRTVDVVKESPDFTGDVAIKQAAGTLSFLLG
jgi:hypothetical protein